jgi:hypothetical protein
MHTKCRKSGGGRILFPALPCKSSFHPFWCNLLDNLVFWGLIGGDDDGRALPVDMFPHTDHCEVIMLLERDLSGVEDSSAEAGGSAEAAGGES